MENGLFSFHHGRRSERIATLLGEDIIEGRLKPGERISEQALAARFGTSRGPIREALRRLEERGLITTAPNIGACVARYSLGFLIELYQAREALEGMAARLAAQSMTTTEKAELRCLCETAAAALRDNPDAPYQQLPDNQDFHVAIARGARNQVLHDALCRDLYPLLRLCRREHGRTPGRGARALVEHFRVLEAIEDGDGELAELTMRKHIIASRRNLEEIRAANMSTAQPTEPAYDLA